MYASTKQISITAFILLTILFGLSLMSASQANAAPISAEPPIYIQPETLHQNTIRQMIIKFNPRLPDLERETIIAAIIEESAATDFDPLLIASIIAAESSFRPGAVSPCEARGLMQVTDCVSQIMKIADPYDIRQNIYAGTRYLQDLYRQFQQFELLLAAYNAGPTRVARLGRVPQITETVNYIQRVNDFYQSIRTELLTTIDGLIGKPVFDPISHSLDYSHRPAIAADTNGNGLPFLMFSVAQDWCEPGRSINYLCFV